MNIQRNYKFYAFASALALSFVTAGALGQPEPGMGANMTEQLANFGGAMHATAEICGEYSAAQLQQSKQKQQELLQRQGMDQAKFEQIFSAAMKQTEAKWKTLSKAEQDAACEEIKQYAAKMAP